MTQRMPMLSHAMRGQAKPRVAQAIAAAIAMVAVSVAGSGCDPRATTRPDVVLVTLDTTRADHLGAYGYHRAVSPEIDRFAQDAVLHRRAWSTSSWTLPAHASILTGKHPTSHGAHFAAKQGDTVLGDAMSEALLREFRSRAPGPRVNRLGADHVTLAELLTDAGYSTAAFAGGPWLSEAFGLLQGYQHRDAEIHSMSGVGADELTTQAIDWLRHVPAQRPLHMLVNYFDPHSPYEPPAGYADYPAAKRPLRVSIDAGISGKPLPPRQREAYIDRYDGEIRFMDHHFGRLLGALRDAGRYENALIVVVSDHGEQFGEHALMGHGRTLYDTVLRVPLLIHYPAGRGAGTTLDAPVSVVDILPLVVAELDLELPTGVEGVAIGERDWVIGETFPDAHSIRLYGKRFDRSLRSGVRWPWKLVLSDRGAAQLYNLDEDPGELNDLAGSPIEAELRSGLALATANLKPPESAERPAGVSAETNQQLRALGYTD